MSLEANIIIGYSRKEAIADGLQIQADEKTCKEAGMRFPVYFTKGSYDKYVKVPEGMEGMQDESGRLWDIVYMFCEKIRRAKRTGEELSQVVEFQFSVSIPKEVKYSRNEKRESDNQRIVTLKCELGAFDFDDGQPTFTFSKPQED